MTETITVEEYRKLAGKKQKAPAQPAKPKKTPDLVTRLCTLLAPYRWTCDLYRAFCTDERNPENTAIDSAQNNAVVIFRVGNECHMPRAAHLGWLWEVHVMSDAEIIARVQEVEKEANQ